jgi:hypothetical protein
VDIDQDLYLEKMETIKRSLAEVFLLVEDIEEGQAKGLQSSLSELETEEIATELAKIHQNESFEDGGFGIWDE